MTLPFLSRTLTNMAPLAFLANAIEIACDSVPAPPIEFQDSKGLLLLNCTLYIYMPKWPAAHRNLGFLPLCQ